MCCEKRVVFHSGQAFDPARGSCIKLNKYNRDIMMEVANSSKIELWTDSPSHYDRYYFRVSIETVALDDFPSRRLVPRGGRRRSTGDSPEPDKT